MIFVDTGAIFAYAIPDDMHYYDARQWVQQNRIPLLITDYVVDETLTLLRGRAQAPRAIEIGKLLFARRFARIYYLTEEDILDAWRVFYEYSDKEWSFTDCTSKVIIERLALTQAFAFDRHFHQFGTVMVVP